MPGCDANHEGDANIIIITLNLNVNKGIKIQESFIMVISIEERLNHFLIILYN